MRNARPPLNLPARLPRSATAWLASVSVAGLLLAGCAGEPTLVEGLSFPAGLKQTRTIPVQVERINTDIRLTNTTDQTLSGRLWANQWWSRTLDPVPPGRTVTLDLRTFKDKFNTSYRAGGFFATENPDKLVLTQLQTDSELIGLLTLAPAE